MEVKGDFCEVCKKTVKNLSEVTGICLDCEHEIITSGNRKEKDYESDSRK